MKLAIVVAVVAACYFEGALAGGDQSKRNKVDNSIILTDIKLFSLRSLLLAIR